MNPVLVVENNPRKDLGINISLWKVALQDLDQEPSWHRFILIGFVALSSESFFHLSLAVDLLEDLDRDELHRVQKQLADLTAVEHPVLAAELHEQGLPVRDKSVRRLLNHITALPSGNVYHPVQVTAQQDVSHVRQMYLSTSLFDNAVIFRVVLRHSVFSTATQIEFSYFGSKMICHS